MPNPNLPNQAGYNTYVGARYVPVFSSVNNGQWTNTVEYEPLTIVMHNGNSYTSKTYVPIGIDIDNTTYWALTGNYNAQIEAYRKEVQQYAQQSQLWKKFNGKQILIIGASNEDETERTTWAGKFKKILDSLGANVTINADGGRKLTGQNGGADVFSQNAESYDIIIICTGRNDYWGNVDITNYSDTDNTTLRGAFKQILQAIKTNSWFSKEIYFMGFLLGPDISSYNYDTYHYSWTSYNYACMALCQACGINYIDAYHFGGCVPITSRSSVAPDGAHYKSPYIDMIAENMITAILNNTNNTSLFYNFDRFTFRSAFTANDDDKFIIDSGTPTVTYAGNTLKITMFLKATQEIAANTLALGPTLSIPMTIQLCESGNTRLLGGSNFPVSVYITTNAAGRRLQLCSSSTIPSNTIIACSTSIIIPEYISSPGII